MTFKNRRNFTRQTFEIERSSLRINKKDLMDEIEYEISFEQIDRSLPIEQPLNNIQFLRNREIITDEEYKSLKDQLLGRENKSLIGFGGNQVINKELQT